MNKNSTDSIARIAFDICMLDWESMTNLDLRQEVKAMGRYDWVIVSNMLHVALRDDMCEVDSQTKYGTKVLAFLTKIRAFDEIFLRSESQIRTELQPEDKRAVVRILDALRPERPIS